jgi:4-amino-4-deoxy-L-arabinose transferase-like glycosyltransferase
LSGGNVGFDLPTAIGQAHRRFLAMSTHPGLGGTHRQPAVARRAVRRLAGATIALSTALFLLANGVGLSDPGLQYDELLFVNAALGDTHPYHGFIYSEALGIPTMLMAYIGALKAWLYAPIFSVFGVTVDSIRLPVLLLAALALVFATVLVARLLGRWPAAVLAVLLATDPVYGAVARADWGPIVLSALLRTAALLCYFALLRRHSVRYLWLLVIALSLGLFNKLDYVWFIAAIGIAALVVHRRELLEIARRQWMAVILPVASFVVVLIAVFVTLILPATRLPLAGSHASLGGRISEVGHLFRITVDGTGVYQYMTGSPLDHATLMGSLFPWIFIGCTVVAVWNLAFGRRRDSNDALREAATTTTFFLILFSVLAVGITLTRQATGPQHIMLVWPLPSVLAVCLLATTARVRIRGHMVAVMVVGAALVVLLLTQVRTTAAYVQAYRSDRSWNTIWSPEIYAAAHAVSRSAPEVESVITADWGLGNQIFALGNEAVRDRFGDPWPTFSNPATTPASLEREWFQRRRVIVVFHTPAGEIMPLTTQRVEAILKSLGARASILFKGRQIEAEEVVP